ncbi:MAG: homocitrate synthase [Scytonema sp. PMC 1069.18]|nr:homocitrate synthase [Scytonema sp. PMC 1069.18]MEC4885337.1 homocitrate synthase [Scytonema sp. PMC 1070.18]
MVVTSISDRVLSDDIVLNFHDSIDLMDETLREGAERSSISPSLDEKCKLGKKISEVGVRSLVIGFLPHVPHSIELLKRLVELQKQGEISDKTRFIVLSYVGEDLRRSFQILNQELGESLANIWVIAVHTVSDQQINHIFWKILAKEPTATWNSDNWSVLTLEEQKQIHFKWFEDFLPTLQQYQGGGIILGLLDIFRADINYARKVVDTAVKNGIAQIRLVDTAGTCLPQQIEGYVSSLVKAYPNVSFYGHFHNDFGMATGNAILGLSSGLRGVDISVGGFASRAGHPPLAEIALALHDLYGITLPDFHYDQLYELSRLLEKTYGLMECPTQPVTGVITHSIYSSSRNEVLKKAPTIYDVIDPSFVGSNLNKGFGVRSGKDGIRWFLKNNREKLQNLGIDVNEDKADEIFFLMVNEWHSRSQKLHIDIQEVVSQYYQLLNSAFFTEEQMIQFLAQNYKSGVENEFYSITK